MPKRLFILSTGTAIGQAFDMRQGLPPLLRPDIWPTTTVGLSAGYCYIAIAPNLSYAITASASSVRIFTDLTGLGSSTTPPLSFTGTVECCAAGNVYYAIGGASPYLLVFAYPSGAPQVVPTTGLGTVTGLAFSPDGSRLAVAHTTTPYLRIYNTSDWSYIDAGSVAGYGSVYTTSLWFTPDGASVVVFAVSSTYISVFDAATGVRGYTNTSNTYTLAAPSYASVRAALCPDGKTVVFLLNNSPYIATFDLTTNTPALFPAASPAIGVPFTLWVDPDPDEDAVYVAHAAGSTSPTRYITKFTLSTGAVCADQANGVLKQMSTDQVGLVGICTTPYQITGTVRDVNNNPCARVVRAYDRATGNPMAQTTSDATTGNYTLKVYDPGPYDVQFMTADGELLNDLFFSQTEPEPVGS